MSRVAAAPPFNFPLLHHQGVAGDATQGPGATAVATANTSIGREVEFWFEFLGGTLVLHTSRLETPDPFDGRLIQSFPEVVCTHENLALIRIRTTHRNFPTDYFVFSFPRRGASAGQPSVVRLPDAAPEMASASTEWKQEEVTLSFPKGKEEEYMRSWHTDLVIPFDGSLLWIDLLRGILRCPNLCSKKGAMFEYLALPPDLSPAWNPSGADLKIDCKPFRTVGCCNGELKLVNLPKTSNNSTLCIAIWRMQAHAPRGGWSWSNKITVPINYTCSWTGINPKPKLHLCFPLLCPNNRNILYLTVVADKMACNIRNNNNNTAENKAWLLQINMAYNAPRQSDIADYPGFWSHRNALYPSDLSEYISAQIVG